MTACSKPGPDRLAADADRRYDTSGFTWLAAHDPSALVAWGVAPDELREIAPSARVEAARGAGACAQASRSHAALFVVIPTGPDAAARRAAALDCGVALYRDARVVVIAPR